MQDTVKTLIDHGIRPSQQRICVLHYIQSVKTHPTVDTIFSALQPDYPTLSRTTVYNTLELLREHNLVITLDMGEGFLRYDADMHPHSHFKCEKCGNVFDIFEKLPNVNSMVPKGFKLRTSALYMFGLCKKCSK